MNTESYLPPALEIPAPGFPAAESVATPGPAVADPPSPAPGGPHHDPAAPTDRLPVDPGAGEGLDTPAETRGRRPARPRKPRSVGLRRAPGFDYDNLDINPEAREAVRAATDDLHTLVGRIAEQIVVIGRRLNEVKARLPHGSFGPWLEAEFGWSEDTARRYRRVADQFGQKLQFAGFAAMALYTLSAPGVPEAARDEACEKAAAGERITSVKAQEIVEAHRLRAGADRDGGPAHAPADGGAGPAAAVRPSGLSLPTVPAATGGDGDCITLEDWGRMPEAERRRVIGGAGGTKEFNAQRENESIEWARWSWNPVTGCLHNCPYCYARDIATLGRTASGFPNGFEPTLIPSRLGAPRNTRFPADAAAASVGHKNVFVCSMADLFGRWVPREWIDAVLAEVRAAPLWNFLFLTKFPARMAEFDFPDNAWVGTTVDCQARVASAEKAFRKVKAGVKWLSCEPLIEPLKFADLGAFDWLVLGGSSKSSRTPEWHPPRAWVNALEAEAESLGVKVYEKANLLERFRQYPGVEAAAPSEAPAQLRYLPTDR